MPNPSSLPNQSKITLVMGGEKLTGWSGLQLINSINSGADAFSFSIPWQPTAENITRFNPSEIKNLQIYVDDELILNGYKEISSFAVSGSERQLNIQGRSASGTIIDVDAGPPFQYDNMNLNDISTRMYQEFDSTATVGVAFISSSRHPVEAAKKFPEVTIEPGQKIFAVLSNLASSLGLWAAPIASGRLEFRKFIQPAGETLPALIEGQSPVRSVTSGIDLTKRFQRYMVIGTYEGDTASSEVLDGQSFGFARRGRQITELQQQSTGLEEAAKFARSKAVIDSYSCSVEVNGWHYNGKLWRAGDFVTLQAPGAYVINKTTLIIQRVTLQIDETGGQITALDLNIPEAFKTADIEPDKLPYTPTVVLSPFRSGAVQ